MVAFPNIENVNNSFNTMIASLHDYKMQKPTNTLFCLPFYHYKKTKHQRIVFHHST